MNFLNIILFFFFFFSSRRRHTRFDCDWSSDVCSSDLAKVSTLRRRPLKVDTFAVVSTPVAGALELVLAGFPIRCAAQVSTASVDDKHAIRRAVHPDAVFLLPLGIYTEGVVRGVTNLEDGGGVEERTGKKKLKEGDEPSAQETSDSSPDETPPPLVNFTRLGTDSRQTASRCCFGCTDGRRTNIRGCISATGSGCFPCVWLWFCRFSFRARHAITPRLQVIGST